MKLQHLYERRHKPAKQKDSVAATDMPSDASQGLDTDPFAFGTDNPSAIEQVNSGDSAATGGVPQEPTIKPQPASDAAPQSTSKVEIPKQVTRAMSAMSDIKSDEDSAQKELAGDCYDLLQHLVDMGDHEGMISFAEIALHMVDADLPPTTKSKVPPFVGK